MNYTKDTPSQKLIPSPGGIFERMVHDTLDPYFLEEEISTAIEIQGKENFFRIAQIIYAAKNNLIKNLPSLIDTQNTTNICGQKMVMNPFSDASVEMQKSMIGIFARKTAISTENFLALDIEQIFREQNIQMSDIIEEIQWTEKNEVPFSLEPVIKGGVLNIPGADQISVRQENVTPAPRANLKHNPLISGKPQKNQKKIPEKSKKVGPPLPYF